METVREALAFHKQTSEKAILLIQSSFQDLSLPKQIEALSGCCLKRNFAMKTLSVLPRLCVGLCHTACVRAMAV